MNTDTDALTERIRRARSLPAEWARRQDGETTMEQTERWQKRQDEQTAALVAVEVRKAKAEALREAAFGIDLDKVAEEWSQGPGNRNDMHWAAANAASSVVLALHDRAAEYETGDRA